MAVQGRKVEAMDLDLIGQLLNDHPSWGRRRLSRELCQKWDWRNTKGQLKDMACRSLLLKLEERGHITLPARRVDPMNSWRRCAIRQVPPPGNAMNSPLTTLLPLTIKVALPGSRDDDLLNGLLSGYHYLGYRCSVGENIKYLIQDAIGRPLACALFGSAAWKTAPRDTWIGWEAPIREKNLPYVTNNMRFLILPWVRVPHLASYILARIARRIRSDWMAKYGHPIALLETFVDRSRFRGVCYRAANWILTGQTQGRSRNDRHHTLQVPKKDVYVYPLIPNFRQELCR